MMKILKTFMLYVGIIGWIVMLCICDSLSVLQVLAFSALLLLWCSLTAILIEGIDELYDMIPFGEYFKNRKNDETE